MILGLVTDNVAVDRVQVTVNGVEMPLPRDLAVVGRGVPIRVPASLQPGANVIEITAADKTGNVSQLVRIVTRLVPAAPLVKVANRWAVVIGINAGRRRDLPVPHDSGRVSEGSRAVAERHERAETDAAQHQAGAR